MTVVLPPDKARAEFEALVGTIRDRDKAARCAWLLSQITLAGGIANDHDFKRLYPGETAFDAMTQYAVDLLKHDWEAWNERAEAKP